MDPKYVFLTVPSFCWHNLINILNIISRNVSKKEINEQLRKIDILRHNLPALKFKYVGEFSKCSTVVILKNVPKDSGSKDPSFSQVSTSNFTTELVYGLFCVHYIGTL